MDQLKKDLDHIKVYGIDSGALYKRVCKHLAELLSYKATGLEPEEIEKIKAEVDFDRLKEIWGETPAKVEFGVPFDRLRELIQAERDGRLVVLANEVTVDELHALFRKLNERQGDCAETYTTGYRNGHRNGQIELLVWLLGFPDPHGGVTEAAVERIKGAVVRG